MKSGLGIVALASVVLASLLAGCVSEEELSLPSESAPPGEDVIDESTEAAAPEWVVGQWFGHHAFYNIAPGDQRDYHFNTIVVRDDGPSWFLAADEPVNSKFEAVFDVPILGPMMKGSLDTTSFGVDWRVYDFPIAHNKTWTSTYTFPSELSGVAPYSVTATHHALFVPEIRTMDGKTFPGFEIEATAEDGTRLLKYDYVPAIGWYAHFWMYNVMTRDDPDDWFFHSMSMGFGMNWTGTYYTQEAVLKAESESYVAADPTAPQDSGQGLTPPMQFTISESATSLFGYAGAGAFMSTARVDLVDPTNGRHEWTVQSTDMDVFVFNFWFVEIPAEPGSWTLATSGVGPGWFAFAGLWELTQVEASLTAPS